MILIAHVDVPKDLNGIRTTFAFGLSGKQLLMLSAGAIMAFILTALLRSGFGLTLFTSFLIASIPTLVPTAFCTFYKKNGMSFGKIAKIVLHHQVRHRQIRLYKTKNFYYQTDKSNNVVSDFKTSNTREGPNGKNAIKKSTKQYVRNKKG